MNAQRLKEIRKEYESGYALDPPSSANDHVGELLNVIDALGTIVRNLLAHDPYDNAMTDWICDEHEWVCHFCNATYPQHAEECAWVVAKRLFQ